MSAYRLGSNSFSLANEFAFFPLRDEVDALTGLLNPNTGKCGTIDLIVLDQDLQPSSFVYFNGNDRIVMEPTLNEPINNGIHLLYLRASMTNYDGYVDIPFFVTV